MGREGFIEDGGSGTVTQKIAVEIQTISKSYFKKFAYLSLKISHNVIMLHSFGTPPLFN